MNLFKILTIIALFGFIAVPAAASVSFVSSAPQIITKGDAFSVSGSDEQNGPPSLWIIGRDYFDVKTAVQTGKGNWTLTLKYEDTEKFPGGKYAIVIQDPGLDMIQEIDRRIADNGNITIQNRGKMIADIGPPSSLTSDIEPVIAILDSAAALQGVDDTFSTYYFFVEEPSVQFDQVTDPTKRVLSPRVSGDQIVLNGSTNMGIEDSLRVDVRNLASNTIVTSKIIPIEAGTDLNRWIYTLEPPGLPPGNYSVTLGRMKSNTSSVGSAFFVVENPAVSPPPRVLPTPASTFRSPPSDNIPFPFIIESALLIVLIIIIYTIQRR